MRGFLTFVLTHFILFFRMPCEHPLDSKPSGHNCRCRYPLPEGVGECFAYNVVGAVDIGMNPPAIRCAIEATGFALATETRFLGSFGIVSGNVIPIQKRGLARVALLNGHHLDSDAPGLVGELLNEPGMWNLNEFLIIFPPHFHLLLPQRIFAHDKGPDSFLDQQIDDPTACRMQIGVDTAIALRRDPIELAGSEAVGFRQVFL
jgi:hypothetical protein